MSVEAVSSSTTTTTDSSSNTTLSQLDFLTLLTTQMEYQDPTDPVDNSEMVSQMTQYSMLEQQTSTNDKLDTILSEIQSMSTINSSSYLGQKVSAEGGIAEVSDGEIDSTVTITLSDDAANLGINIYDSDGNIVATNYYEDVSSGTFTIDGDEINASGALTSDGYYTLQAFAYDSNGAEVDVSMESEGTVAAISQEDDGVIFTLEDGREVNLTDVTLLAS
jgi:flagellar basal-body rod modification protein FlgD